MQHLVAPPRGALVGTLSASPFSRTRWLAEIAGVMLAVLLALLAVWHLDATDRSWTLYYDGDSVLPALVNGSLLAGQAQDWSLSAVLFIPEMGLYLALAAIGLGVKGTLALSAVVNLLLFYGLLRLLSGIAQHAQPRSHRVAGALVAFGALVSLTLLEDSRRTDTFEIASLLATTTYYSMTVLASVMATAIVARLVTARVGGRRRWLEFALVGVSALSALTNPLYLAWAVAPLGVVLALMAWRRLIGWHCLLGLGAFLALGSGLGLLGRIPLASLFTKYGPVYADLGRAQWSVIYYPAALAERASTIPGALWLMLIIALVPVSAIAFRTSLAARDMAAAVVSGVGWVAPLAVIVGGICLGTFATRYLQPLVFAPVCMLVLAPRLFAHRMTFLGRLSSKVPRLLAGGMVVCLGLSAVPANALTESATAVDPDIRCVDAWISASHRIGAGGFWTIRGPKAYLAEPYRLVQVDRSFGAYPWLTDRADYSSARVSFVLTDEAHPPPALPPEARTAPSSTVRCGRYTITDFGADLLPIGPAVPHPLA